VWAIICQYYPNDLGLVTEVAFDSGIVTILETAQVGQGANARGRIMVDNRFVERVPDNLAQEVLRVRHELDHIEQYRRGMGGDPRQNEREFLGFYQEAFNHPEVPGTGRVSHGTRVMMIDAALGYYNCFGADLQRQCTGHRDRLLARRTEEQRRSGHEATPPPTECRRQPAGRRPR
jgi:hypothetical protein